MFVLVKGGEVFNPSPLGTRDVLLANDRIERIGTIDQRALESAGVDIDCIDARGFLVVPGFIDIHEHLSGGSGEQGFATQTPELNLSEIVGAGITTVAGCLGVDTVMKTMAGLLAKAKALKEEGLTAFIWSGGYSIPPATIMGSIRDDIMFIEEVIGLGEVAIADRRSMEPDPHELARLVSEAWTGGMLSRKAGLTHFHVGDAEQRLSPLNALLDRFQVDASWLYPTHVDRSEKLMLEAIDLARRGAFVDLDTALKDLPKWLAFYLENGGDPARLTASSDASISSPATLTDQIRACVLDKGFRLEQVLPLVTANPASALKLAGKGRLEPGRDADLLVLTKDTLEITHVFARGRQLVRDGRMTVAEKFLSGSNRRINLVGEGK